MAERTEPKFFYFSSVARFRLQLTASGPCWLCFRPSSTRRHLPFQLCPCRWYVQVRCLASGGWVRWWPGGYTRRWVNVDGCRFTHRAAVVSRFHTIKQRLLRFVTNSPLLAEQCSSNYNNNSNRHWQQRRSCNCQWKTNPNWVVDGERQKIHKFSFCALSVDFIFSAPFFFFFNIFSRCSLTTSSCMIDSITYFQCCRFFQQLPNGTWFVVCLLQHVSGRTMQHFF